MLNMSHPSAAFTLLFTVCLPHKVLYLCLSHSYLTEYFNTHTAADQMVVCVKP